MSSLASGFPKRPPFPGQDPCLGTSILISQVMSPTSKSFRIARLTCLSHGHGTFLRLLFGGVPQADIYLKTLQDLCNRRLHGAIVRERGRGREGERESGDRWSESVEFPGMPRISSAVGTQCPYHWITLGWRLKHPHLLETGATKTRHPRPCAHWPACTATRVEGSPSSDKETSRRRRTCADSVRKYLSVLFASCWPAARLLAAFQQATTGLEGALEPWNGGGGGARTLQVASFHDPYFRTLFNSSNHLFMLDM